MEPLRIGVAGLGSAGLDLLENELSGNPAVNVVAICESQSQRLYPARQALNLRGYQDYHDLLDDKDVELIAIAAPPDVRPDLAVRAFDAGKHAVVLSPPALESWQYKRMMKAASAADRLLACRIPALDCPAFIGLRDALRDEPVGDVFDVSHAILINPPDWNDLSWHGDPLKGAGILNTLAFEMMCRTVELLPDEIQDAYGRAAGRRRSDDFGDWFWAAVRFRNGSRIILEGDIAAPIPRQEWRVGGRAGEIEILKAQDGPWRSVLRYPGNERALDLPDKPEDFWGRVADAVRDGAELPIRPERVHKAMRVLEALAQSQEDDEPVRI
ncbi:MAG TPA: Gfo/Idh/MocA family oxidoreductase [Candidatus Brocadiia bacterium]|nr:Gfo/Idh/MocA family oxidoreductase [Candidatus Brocadiia bacterium]